MTIKNFKVEGKTLQGEDFKDGDKNLKLNEIIAILISGSYPDESQSLNGSDKFKRALLSIKLMSDDENFTTDELAMIKDVVGKRGNTHVVYRVFTILDGE